MVGATFSHLLSLVTNMREVFPWVLFLLPLGGLATVWLYHHFGLDNHRGANEIVHDLKNEKPIRVLAAPLIFASTAITHLCGGSAGREGAALQIGGAGASALSDALHLKGRERIVFVMSGMSAVFTGVFGTPLTAAFFVLEFKTQKRVFPLAVLPCLISALVAKLCDSLLGVTEGFVPLTYVPSLSFALIGKLLVLALGLVSLGMVMCFLFENAPLWAKTLVSNPFVRTLLFTTVVFALTACVGDMRYNGSGLDVTLRAIAGNANWYDFILKMVFTTITIAAGLKGGEIVPTFCIGATFGCFFGGLLGLDAGLAAALGLVGLFCCVTNSFISAIFLGIELFGFSAFPYMAIICSILWLLFVHDGLFENRVFTSPLLKRRKEQP